MRGCFWMRGLLARNASNLLGGILARYTKKHLDLCPNCREALARLLNLNESLHKIRPAEQEQFSDRTWQSLIERIEER